MHRLLILCLAVVAAACAPDGPTAYVDFNLVPTAECVYDPSGDVEFYGEGYYDISVSGAESSAGLRACARSYVLNLRVNSGLRSSLDQEQGRAEPNVLQVTRVEVLLLTTQGEVLSFGDDDGALSNPFQVTTTISLEPTSTGEPSRGVAKVEAIPVAYGEQLGQFAGQQILAQVQLFGRTLGDVEVDFQPYSYPIRICEGCMSLCLNDDIVAAGLTSDEVLDADECQDNSGADGRICIDPNC